MIVRYLNDFFARRLNKLLTNGYSSSETLSENINFDSTESSNKSRLVHSTETVVYEQYHNNFIHEAGLPRGVQFMNISQEIYKEYITLPFGGNPKNTLTVNVLQDNTLIFKLWLA